MKKTQKILKALKIVFRIWMNWEYRRGRKGFFVLFQSKHSFALVYRAHSICFQFPFFKPSVLIDWNERKKRHALATQPIGCKRKTNQIMITWCTFPRFLLQRYTVDHVKAMNRALFSWKILSRLLLNVIASRNSLFD